MLKQFLKSKIQKGQSLVFVGISLPILFLFVAAAADFGWLYLNQSRLQNAADAAATAAAITLTERDQSEYIYSKFVANSDERLTLLASQNKIMTEYDTEVGDVAAKDYAELNLKGFLGDENLEIKDVSSGEENLIPDAWNTVKFKRIVYGTDSEDNNAIYYVVILSEKLNHLFDIMDKFGIENLNSKAMAVVKLDQAPQKEPPHGPTLYWTMTQLRQKSVYAHWWEIQQEFDKLKKQKEKGDAVATAKLEDYTSVSGADDMARMRSVQAKGNEYIVGNYYRTETLTLHGWSQAASTNGGTKGNKMDQRNFPSLFVDFKVDINKSGFDNDPASNSGGGYNLYYKDPIDNKENKSITDETVLKYRIHDLINVGKWNGSAYTYEYKVRDGTVASTEGSTAYDPLYVMIESEDNYADGNSGNTVRQIIINVNVANTAKDDRPIFFFYDGPQKPKSIDGKTTYKRSTRWDTDWRETWKHLGYVDDVYVGHARNSLPVILNLNANFNGVLFMPNSPVVINGNGYKLEGFVVAEKFLKLKEAHDFPIKAEGGNPENKITDGRGNIYYLDDEGCTFYHAAAEGGTRYIHLKTPTDINGNAIKDSTGKYLKKYLNVIYSKYEISETDVTVNPDTDIIKEDDNIYEVTKKTPSGDYVTKYVKLTKSQLQPLYTYTLIEKEKSNIISTYKDSEKDYVKVYPMYIDQLGNVQYRPLRDSDDYKYSVRPTPLDSAWHSNYGQGLGYDKWDDENEIIYKPSTFNLNSSTCYNSYNKFTAVDYTKLNDNERNINDVFYTTIRSDWID